MQKSEHPYYKFMLEAITLAKNAHWLTAPNPAVGAVLVKDEKIVASGWHKGSGFPHAEIEALNDAAAKGINPSECTLVVTLEPCNHFGKMPPCSQAILQSGIKHVVVGAMDPNPVAAGGTEVLRAAGVTVETGIAEEECLDLIGDFIVWKTTELPYVVLKLAGTMDGRIATRNGHSQWVSSEGARQRVHDLRKYMQAVIIGGNTFFLDDPQLTCRAENLPSDFKQPLAVVVTSRLPDASARMHLLDDRPESAMFWTTVAAAASPKAEALRRKGVQVIGLQSSPRPSLRGHGMRAELNISEGLKLLRQEYGCQYVLCEGGGKLGLALLDKGLVGEFHLHLAPKILGDNEATPIFDGLSPQNMQDAISFRTVNVEQCSGDLLVTMRPNRTQPDEAPAEKS